MEKQNEDGTWSDRNIRAGETYFYDPADKFRIALNKPFYTSPTYRPADAFVLSPTDRIEGFELIFANGVARPDITQSGTIRELGLFLEVAQAAETSQGDVVTGVEHLIGSSHDDSLTGDDADNRIDGRGGDDLLSGGDGDDTLDGGAGNDTASYAGASGGVTVDLSNSSAQNTGGAGSDTLSNIENLIGSDHHDTLTGDAGANRIDGGAGHDVIDGGGGADILSGGAGVDTVSYASASAGVRVNLAIQSGLHIRLPALSGSSSVFSAARIPVNGLLLIDDQDNQNFAYVTGVIYVNRGGSWVRAEDSTVSKTEIDSGNVIFVVTGADNARSVQPEEITDLSSLAGSGQHRFMPARSVIIMLTSMIRSGLIICGPLAWQSMHLPAPP